MAYLVLRNKIFHIYYYDNFTKHIKSVSTRTNNKTEANKKLKEFIAKQTLNLHPSHFVKPDKHRLNISEALELLIASKSISKSYKTSFHLAIKHLINAIGNVPVSQINEMKYNVFIQYLNRSELSQTSKATYTRHIFTLFNFLVQNKILETNQTSKLKAERKEVRPFDSEKLPILFDYLKSTNKKYYDAVKLIYLCAYRISEFTSAEWSDFDFKNERIYIRNTKGNATIIPMLQDTKEHLLQSNFNKNGRVSDWKNKDGMKTFWKTAINNLNLQFNYHSLRKARGTDLANSGANPFFLMKYMRHSDMKVTMQYYIKIDLDKAKVQLNNVLKQTEILQ